MSTSNYIDAEEPSKNKKLEYEEVERDMYVVPFEIYDETVTDDSEIEDGTIKQTGESTFEISLSKEGKSFDKQHATKGKKSGLETVHTILDIAGFIPVLGAAPDLLNGLIYCCEGDFTNMGLSLVAAVPMYGDAAAGVVKGVKYGGKITSSTGKIGGKISTASAKRFINTETKLLAEEIVQKAARNNVKSISFFWTNGTKFNAKSVAREIHKLNPNIKLKTTVLESSAEGIKLEKLVNRKLVEEGLRQGYKKEELFVLLKKNELWGKVMEKAPSQFKQSLEALQRRKSVLYAKSSKNSDWIIRFRQEGGSLGPASIEEQKVLDKAHKEINDINLMPDEVLKRVLQQSGSTKIIRARQ